MFDSKNIKFYIMLILSIIIYTISFYNNSSVIAFAILLLIIATSTAENKTLKYIGTVITVIMTVGFVFITFFI